MKASVPSDAAVDAVFLLRHTGNTVPTLTLKISKQLRAQIAAAAKRRQISQSELVREAIEASLRQRLAPEPSAYDSIRDLIEALPNEGPVTDRSTNKKWLAGFGLDNAALGASSATPMKAGTRSRGKVGARARRPR